MSPDHQLIVLGEGKKPTKGSLITKKPTKQRKTLNRKDNNAVLFPYSVHLPR